MNAFWNMTRFAIPLNSLTSPDFCYPNQIVVIDVNGDSLQDLIISYGDPQYDGAIPAVVLLNNGNGGFVDGTATIFPGGAPGINGANNVSVADFNGDGRLDVFYGEFGQDSGSFPGMFNTLLLSSGTSGFVDASANLPVVKDFTHASSFGDINGDGFVDLLVVNVNGGSPSSGPTTAPYLLLNNGQGVFARSDALPAEVLARGVPYFSTGLIFDANGDGKQDLLVGGAEVPGRIYINPGNGDFSAANHVLLPLPPMQNPPFMLIAKAIDLNGDGALDLIITYDDSPLTSHFLQILINDGFGNFIDDSVTRMPDSTRGLNGTVFKYGLNLSENFTSDFFLTDINGDGHTDVLLKNGMQLMPVLLNDGTGHFVHLPPSFVAGYSDNSGGTFVSNYYPADVNADGRTDLVIWDQKLVIPVPENRYAILTQVDPGLTQTGTSEAEALLGDGSHETLSGLGGDDVIFGGAGNDILDGGSGADTLVGGSGLDSMTGGADNDTYVVDNLGDSVIESAGEGTDTVRTSLTAFTLPANVENLVFVGGAAAILTGNAEANSITGGIGNDSLDGGAGADTLAGRAGNDTYVVDGFSDVVTENAGEGTDTVQTALGSSTDYNALYFLPDDVENLTLTGTAQGAHGNALDNVITGSGGNDLLVLSGTAPFTLPAQGTDTVNAGGGDDYLFFGGSLDALDTIDGGAGYDFVGLLGTYSGLVLGPTSFAGVDRLAMYSSGNAGTPYSYSITTHDGNVAAGQTLAVTAATLLANETLTFNGSAETNGKFQVTGGRGADSLTGGAGADRFIGGLGADVITGGLGNDVFQYNTAGDSTAAARDQILDFAAGDKLDLWFIDANAGLGGNQKFDFIGSAVFSNTAGQLRATQQSPGQWLVEGDVDGDGLADLSIAVTVSGGHLLGAGDFVL